MKLTILQQQTLLTIYAHGRENPITGRQIIAAVKLRERASGKEGADMRSIINALRTKGFPIGASGDGYWYARTPEDLSTFISEFQGRIDKQQQACDGLNNAFDKIGKDPRDIIDLPKPWHCPRCDTDNNSSQDQCGICYLDRRDIVVAKTDGILL